MMTLRLEAWIKAKFSAMVLSPAAQLLHHVATCHSMIGWPLNDCRFMVLPLTRKGASTADAFAGAGAFFGAISPLGAAQTGGKRAASTAKAAKKPPRARLLSFCLSFC